MKSNQYPKYDPVQSIRNRVASNVQELKTKCDEKEVKTYSEDIFMSSFNVDNALEKFIIFILVERTNDYASFAMFTSNDSKILEATLRDKQVSTDEKLSAITTCLQDGNNKGRNMYAAIEVAEEKIFRLLKPFWEYSP